MRNSLSHSLHVISSCDLWTFSIYKITISLKETYLFFFNVFLAILEEFHVLIYSGFKECRQRPRTSALDVRKPVTLMFKYLINLSLRQWTSCATKVDIALVAQLVHRHRRLMNGS